MIRAEADDEKALGVRPSVSAVIFDRREVHEETGLTVRPRRIIACIRIRRSRWCDETLALAYFAPGRLPGTLLPNHRIRIRDARARRAAAAIH